MNVGQNITLDALLVEIKGHLPEGVWCAERLAGGVESNAVLLRGPAGVKKLLKYPPSRETANDNDPDLDFLDLYLQDEELARICIDASLPVPQPSFVLESVFGVPVLVMEYVEHDSTPPDDFEFGRLARRIHALRGMKSGTAAMRGKGIAKVVTELTCARLNIATAISGRTLLPISPRRLENLLAPIGNSDNLLHMDLRFENVLCQHGKPCAVIDWANALIGDPLLEIARIHEYGLLSSNFSKGYGDCRLTEALNEPIGLACSLYTAAMMCILFLSEIPDEREAAKRLDRLEWLVGEIARRTGVGSS